MTEQRFPVAVVQGVGPGLGAAVARRFAREGFAVALMARSADALDGVASAITAAGGRALAVPCDVTDEAAVGAAFARVRESLGDPEVYVYNAGAFVMAGVLDMTAAQLESAWRTNCLGAFLGVKQVARSMVERGRGTIVLTGATASMRGSARFAALAVGKFGLRAFGQSLARELGPKGVHVAHVVIDGQIDTPRLRAFMPDRGAETMLAPDALADVYWHLHTQDRTCWTQELDVRPSVEKF